MVTEFRRLLAITASLILFAHGPLIQAAEAGPPNIVLIFADDLGYGDVGAFGNQFIHTPRLDQLAAEGVRLTQFFSSANVCTPSRAGLLTGRYPVRSGLAMDVIHPYSEYGIKQEEVLLPEVLRGAGYQTFMVGKWHLGSIPEAWPTLHGFEQFFGVPFSNDMKGVALYHGAEVIESPLDQATVHQQFADEAVRMIENAGDRPFFLYFAPVAPHRPVIPGSKFENRSAAGRYGDVVEEMDSGIGQILDVLERTGRASNTIVVFTSDNGRSWEGSAGNSRGEKATTWEGGYRVPFIARWPGVIPAGTTSNGISMNIDLMPTLAHIAGAPLPQDRPMDGLDILSLLKGGQGSPHEVLYFFSENLIAAVRTQRWRYLVRSNYKIWEIDMFEPGMNYPLLFDIATHGGETYNMAPNYPDVEASMRDYLQTGRQNLEGLPQEETPWREDE